MTTNAEDRRNFDPYYQWLGISPQDQPPDYYRLLGIKPLEDDPIVIGAAAEQRIAHVRVYQLGPYADWSQKILNEIAAAKSCLLNPGAKANYDRTLRPQQGVQGGILRGIASPQPETKMMPPPLLTATAGHWTPWAGRALLLAGLIMALTARSCDTLGDRAAARTGARLDLLANRIEAKWASPGSDARRDDSPIAKTLREVSDKKVLVRSEIERSIDSPEDADFFRLETPVGGRLYVRQMSEYGLDSYLELFDAQAELLTTNDDGGGNRDALVQYDVTAGSTYFVRAASRGNTSGRYRLVLEICEPPGDDDTGNDSASAQPLELASFEGAQADLSEWESLTDQLREADAQNRMSRYWHAWLFSLGSIFLSAGALIVSFTGPVPERWICLAIAAIVIFSLYIGGAGWSDDPIDCGRTAETSLRHDS